VEQGTTSSRLKELVKNYIADVKEYDELLEGDSIDKKFRKDFKNKYKTFNNTKSKEWETYVRNGVKAYRFYKEVKDALVQWVMNIEPPFIANDDQYEMGEEEEYIESETPLVIEKFKKVVSYSNNEKDSLAVREKIARDNNWESSTEKKEQFRNLLLEKNWKGIFDLYFGDIKKDIYKVPNMKLDGSDEEKVKAVVLPKHHYVDENGSVEGVIIVEIFGENVSI
jgi:hypothetical protein